MYYVIYKITNLINNKIYIGKHKTSDLNDNYIGSGVYIKRAIKKYGIENFKKEILHYCTSEEEMNNLELQIVNKDFLNRSDVYNINLGGLGSWDYVNHTLHLNGNKMVIKNKTLEEIKAIRQKAIIKGKETRSIHKQDKDYIEEERKRRSLAMKNTWKIKKHPWIGRKHSVESKQKMSQSHENIGCGEKNSQYGTIWIYNLKLKLNKKIKKEELNLYLNQGWFKGRKLKFN